MPQQPRAAKTRQRVLDAALEVLAEQGFEALNTNLVAEVAGVRVATVYRYFTDKHDVMSAIAEQHLAQLDAWADGLAALADPSTPLATASRQLVHGYYELLQQHPAIVELRAAMRAVPALRVLDEQSLDRWQSRLAGALRQRGSPLKPAELRSATRLLTETVCNGADRTLPHGAREAQRRLEALNELTTAYLHTLC
ncbi:MAG: TetR/AcrR family transcriptional regulator [Pseudomonadota bacterium]